MHRTNPILLSVHLSFLFLHINTGEEEEEEEEDYLESSAKEEYSHDEEEEYVVVKSTKKTTKKKESPPSSHLVHVYSVTELNDSNPKMCSHEKCSLVACSFWESIGPQCLDCQLR